GYWTMVTAVALICVIQRSRRWSGFLRYDAFAALGVVTVVGLAISTSAMLGGHILDRYLSYSGRINQGMFNEGWSLPFEYLWDAEHLLMVVWAGCGACWAWQPGEVVSSPRLRVGLVGLVVVYAILTILSVLLHKFVVYGRLARQLVPFFCLVAAYTFNRLLNARQRTIRQLAMVIIVAMIVQAALNFREPLTQSFPADFIARNQPVDAVAARYQRLLWINAKPLYPGPESVTLPSHYVTLAEARHPLEFLPYQYEGYTPEERQALRAADIHMRLLGVLP